jgi:branched-chain amino acid transport system substrate-binding protein
MRRILATAGITGAFALAAMGAQAQSVKVGVMLTLSGPAAVLGQHARDGFQLGI